MKKKSGQENMLMMLKSLNSKPMSTSQFPRRRQKQTKINLNKKAKMRMQKTRKERRIRRIRNGKLSMLLNGRSNLQKARMNTRKLVSSLKGTRVLITTTSSTKIRTTVTSFLLMEKTSTSHCLEMRLVSVPTLMDAAATSVMSLRASAQDAKEILVIPSQLVMITTLVPLNIVIVLWEDVSTLMSFVMMEMVALIISVIIQLVAIMWTESLLILTNVPSILVTMQLVQLPTLKLTALIA